MENKKAPQYKSLGHRRRLRERFMQSGLDGFLDYEIVELLLTLGTPMKDCKDMAKVAVKRFKGLKGVLDAGLIELQEIRGIGPSNAFGLKLFQAISERYARESLPDKATLDTAGKVAQYLKEKIGREKKEHFVVLYLDTRHRLLHEETISVGTLNASLVHPREVFKPAVDRLAAAVIIAHNHPSGDLTPSTGDFETTARLHDAGRLLGITLLDHLIVGPDAYLSMKEKGFM